MRSTEEYREREERREIERGRERERERERERDKIERERRRERERVRVNRTVCDPAPVPHQIPKSLNSASCVRSSALLSEPQL